MTAVEDVVICPACRNGAVAELHSFRVEEAANHLVPEARYPERNLQLREELQKLFRADHVEVKQCSTCGFCFANPFVAGTADIYRLISGGNELYPRDRFEFSLTIDALRAQLASNGKPTLSLLEIGAGDGAFLRRAHDAGVFERALATEYDQAALAALRRIPGVKALALTPEQLAAQLGDRFDAICMFQVLEHLDSLDSVFAALRALTAQEGQLFISVPNAARVTAQEQLSGFWDMPPNHIGRWNRFAMEAIASRHGFRLREHRYESASDLVELWRLAKYRFEGRAYVSSSLAARVNGLSHRALRGIFKRVLAVYDLIKLAPQYGRIPPESHWFRLGPQ